ncbi:MAG: tRNA (adenosine(37)-N6)-dimethylallyltransferase MiaA [Verrucomicrobia subdivision 3 bacterium]|nr:tRNA (adenosine(37)-N6)-dimethylallyltransferase MiaA [Limisphaerales bacterium]
MATAPTGHDFPRLITIAGPTASGKSEVALLLAERVDGEIISVDSMQVYRGMDIGTAKPGPAERTRVPHHLIDVVEVSQPFNAAQFSERAHNTVREIYERNRVAILCGGTGLYFRAFFQGIGRAPPADPALREQLERCSIQALLDELRRRDPVTYQNIDRKNRRRVIRAIEVIRLTGRPFAEQKSPWQLRPLPHAFGLRREVTDLRERINRRVDLIFKQGLVKETRCLLDSGLAANPTALQALGYRQVVEHIQGRRGLEETIELVKLRTRQFAKRQLTWFRRQLALNWIEVPATESAGRTAGRIIDASLTAAPSPG